MTLETLFPIVIITVFLIGLIVILLLAERTLATTPECTVSDGEQGDKPYVVEGGHPLLSILIEKETVSPSSCGEGQNCGFCKLNTKGGGDISS